MSLSVVELAHSRHTGIFVSILAESRDCPVPQDLSLVTAFFFLIAGVLITLGGEAIVHSRHYRKGIIIAAMGLASFLFGWYWNTLRLSLGVRFVALLENIASDARIWLGLIVLIILYGMATNLIAASKKNNLESIVKEDIPALNAAMRAYVLPRTLTTKQVGAISQCLSNYPPFKVSAQIRQGDREAIKYWVYLQRAIERGGWSIEGVEYLDDLPEGLTIEGRETLLTAQTPHGPNKPKAYTLLLQALNEAGISFEQTIGHGIDTKTDSLVIKVGRRRRDALQPQITPDLG